MPADRDLIDDFLGGARVGRSGGLRIDGDVLAVEMPIPPDRALLVRTGPEAYLLRDPATDADADADVDAFRGEVLERLADRGLQPVTIDNEMFLEVAATIVAAIRSPDWTVWATDRDRGRAAIERILIGEPTVELQGPDAAVGMTLDELTADLEELDEHLDDVARRLEDNGRNPR